MSGTANDIDPELTLGQIALEQKRIREKLIKEGVFNQNKLLPKPIDFCRVVVIHPDNASGFHDFKHLADKLVDVCEFMYVSSHFEGGAVEKEMQAAFDRALALHERSPIDALVIIRGGGSRQGLLTLITENIIRSIASFPAPVMVGVGHTDDKLLIDEVANIACGTPSKVIEYVMQTILRQVESAIYNFNQITSSSDNKLIILMARVNEFNAIIKSKVSSIISIYANKLMNNLSTIRNNAAKQIVSLDKTISENVSSIKIYVKRGIIYLDKNLSQIASAISSIASIKIDNYIANIIQNKNIVLNSTNKILMEYQGNVNHYANELKNNALRQRLRIEEKLNNSFETIELLSPAQTLKRGYCLSVGKSGVIKSFESAEKERSFTIRFTDGEGQVELIEEQPE